MQGFPRSSAERRDAPRDGAFFNNGRSAELVPVAVSDRPQGLEIRDRSDGLMLALWAYVEVMVTAAPTKAASKTLRLTCRTDPGAVLTLEDADLIARLRRRLAAPKRRLPRSALVAILAAAALVVLGLVYQGARHVPPALTRLLPASWDLALGKLAVRELMGDLGEACGGNAGQAALDSLARRLDEANALRFPLAIHVVRGVTVRAVSLPGAQIVISDGLIAALRSPDELAGIIAHEAAASLSASPVAIDQTAREMLLKADIPTPPPAESPVSEPLFQPFAHAALTDKEWQAVRKICDY